MTLIAQRAAGLILLAAAWLPLHRLIEPGVTGLAGQATRRVAEAVWASGLWGSCLTLGAAAVLALAPGLDPRKRMAAGAAFVTCQPAARVAWVAGLLGTTLSLAAALLLLGGRPSSVDEMVQLLHAQALLAGEPALPLPAGASAWLIQNSWWTEEGWISVYPPLHTAVLAVGLAMGTPWLAGPLLHGATSVLTTLGLVRLLPEHPGPARIAGLLTAASPFLFLLAGTHLSHGSAGALAALALWGALRARDGHAGWSVLTGAAVGAFVCARPWAGIAIGVAVTWTTWLAGLPTRDKKGAWLALRGLGWMAGGAPFALALFAWNQALHGAPLRLGYSIAFGPSHGLGFHDDPWGNRYGLREALGYTGADLTQLGTHLLESPLHAVAWIGLGLVMVRSVPSGLGPLLAWAGAGVAANALYWHHGIHFGPRLLFETGPAWVALQVLLSASMLSAARGAILPRAVAWGIVLSVVGGAMLVPGRARSYRPAPETLAAADLPSVPGSEAAVIFAHGTWASRISADLVAAGMRRDSVETALRRNDLCAVDRYRRWRKGPRADAPPTLDLVPRPGSPAGLEFRAISPGNAIPIRPGAPFEEACLREARADRMGTLELEPLLWQAPPLPGRALVVARDLGPEANQEVLRAFPGHRPAVALPGSDGARPRVVAYDEAMALLWGAPPPP